MLSRFRSASLLTFGLALAACGGQTDVRAESQEAIPSPVTTGVPIVVTESPVDGGTSVPDLGLEPAVRQLSPLADQIVPLPAAFPELVFDGLGEPVGQAPQVLSMPSLGVENAGVVPVGLLPNGELEVPGADAVGWYQFGVGVDGGRGSTVLAAHIAYNGRDGVFRNLADTEVGEEIVVGDAGNELTYRVTSIDQYNKLELPIDDLFAESGQERLVLITCGGSFNPSVSSYDDNVVVIAVPA